MVNLAKLPPPVAFHADPFNFRIQAGILERERFTANIAAILIIMDLLKPVTRHTFFSFKREACNM